MLGVVGIKLKSCGKSGTTDDLTIESTTDDTFILTINI